MSEPNYPILNRYEEVRTEGNLFQTEKDFQAQRLWIEEQVEKLGAAVHLFVTSTRRAEGGQNQEPFASGGVDPLYGDILDPEFFENPKDKDKRQINIRCIAEHAPSKQRLKKYGIEEEREAVFHFPFHVLKDKGLVTEFRFRGIDIGDLIEWDGSWYIILSTHRNSYFGQTTSNYFIAATANRYRPNAVPKEDHPQRANDPEDL